MKSCMAAPSFKNSGLEATSKGMSTSLLVSSACMMALTLFAVPTGTVDLVIRIVYFLIFSPKVLATASTYFKSALPSSSGGVPTAEKTNSTLSKQDIRLVEKCRRPASTLRFTISSSPGS